MQRRAKRIVEKKVLQESSGRLHSYHGEKIASMDLGKPLANQFLLLWSEFLGDDVSSHTWGSKQMTCPVNHGLYITLTYTDHS